MEVKSLPTEFHHTTIFYLGTAAGGVADGGATGAVTGGAAVGGEAGAVNAGGVTNAAGGTDVTDKLNGGAEASGGNAAAQTGLTIS